MVLFIFKSQRKHLEMPRDKVTERSLDRTTACGKVAFFCDRMHCLTRLPTFLIEALGFPLLFGFVWLVHLKFRSVPLWLCVLSFRSTNSWTLQLNEQCVCWTRLIERCSLKELHSRWISPADEFVAHHRCTNSVAWILSILCPPDTSLTSFSRSHSRPPSWHHFQIGSSNSTPSACVTSRVQLKSFVIDEVRYLIGY